MPEASQSGQGGEKQTWPGQLSASALTRLIAFWEKFSPVYESKMFVPNNPIQTSAVQIPMWIVMMIGITSIKILEIYNRLFLVKPITYKYQQVFD